MPKRNSSNAQFGSEQRVQDWLESVIAKGTLAEVIRGTDKIDAALRDSESQEMWPSFPIDYLARLRSLQAAKSVLRSLHSLALVSKNNTSLSSAKGERLFADLLYCVEDGSKFIIIEVKNQKASVRETITELLAYEHEILNHLPFAGSHDVLMVIVSRNFSTLLDHAAAGLTTWSRRQILCLQIKDDTPKPWLEVHIPKAWTAIGQKTFPASGIVTAHLSFEPNPGLSEQQIWAVCDTAAALMVREAERAGGSGFAIVAHDHLYPKITQSPYFILAGVVNPFSFLQAAHEGGLTNSSASVLSSYVLSGGSLGDFSISWNWTSSDGHAAVSYLKGYGDACWEGFSDWSNFRDVRRWRHDGLTPDRHITPVSIDFWGVLGDFARDAVRRPERMRRFMPGLTKPGLDWRNPRLGILLLDETSIESVVDAGQWKFSTLFDFGLRLGRMTAITAQYAEVDESIAKLMGAGVFWAEADVAGVLHEVALRYMSSAEMTEPPPQIPIGLYDSGDDIIGRTTKFANWILEHFIGGDEPLMQAAFQTGLNCYGLFDLQFGCCESPNLAPVKAIAVRQARRWLKLTASAATGDLFNATEIASALEAAFSKAIPLDQSEAVAFAAIEQITEDTLIDRLFHSIPRLVDLWHPQLWNTLAPVSTAHRDWDWYEEQIRAARARGEKNPCLYLSAGGQMGIGRLPDDLPVPTIKDPDKEVLLVDNQTFVEIITTATWEQLRVRNTLGMTLHGALDARHARPPT